MRLDDVPILLERLDSNTRGEVEEMFGRLPKGARLTLENIDRLQGISDVGKAYLLYLAARRDVDHVRYFGRAAATEPLADIFEHAIRSGLRLRASRAVVDFPANLKLTDIEPGHDDTLRLSFVHRDYTYEFRLVDASLIRIDYDGYEAGERVSLWDAPDELLRTMREGFVSKIATLAHPDVAALARGLSQLATDILKERPSLQERFEAFLTNPHGSLVGDTDMQRLSKIAAEAVKAGHT